MKSEDKIKIIFSMPNQYEVEEFCAALERAEEFSEYRSKGELAWREPGGIGVWEITELLMVAAQHIVPKIIDFLGTWITTNAPKEHGSIVMEMTTADGRKIHFEALANTPPEKIKELLRATREELQQL